MDNSHSFDRTIPGKGSPDYRRIRTTEGKSLGICNIQKFTTQN